MISSASGMPGDDASRVTTRHQRSLNSRRCGVVGTCSLFVFCVVADLFGGRSTSGSRRIYFPAFVRYSAPPGDVSTG